MAIRELNAVIHANYEVAGDTEFHAGAVLAQDTSTGLVRVANRGNSSTAPTGVGDRAPNIVGLSADDTARTGNTMIQVDPVGSSSLSGGGATFNDNVNGFFVANKRALGDYQDETITNITNLTDGDSTGYATPRRGCGVYTTPSSQFVTDQFAQYQTAASNGAYLDEALSSTFSPGDILTFGSAANRGLLVRRTATVHGMAVARVDRYDSTAGLLYITMLMDAYTGSL